MSNSASSTMVNTYFDVGKLLLWADKGDREKTPSIKLSFMDGNPRFVVNTGEPVGGLINFPTNFDSMAETLEVMDSIIDAEPGTVIVVAAMGLKYVNDKPTDEEIIRSKLVFGKNKEGLIFFAVIEDNKPKIEFAFRKTKWHRFYESNQVEMNESSLTKFYARGYVHLVKNVLALALWDYTKQAYEHGEYKPTPMKPRGQGNFNKGGNYQKGSYGGTGGAKSQGAVSNKAQEEGVANFDAFDSDVPF